MTNTVALLLLRSHYAYMGMMEDAVRRALRTAPVSTRTLAREAGISETLLRLIRSGERTATPQTVKALLEALDRLQARYKRAGQLLRDALKNRSDP